MGIGAPLLPRIDVTNVDSGHLEHVLQTSRSWLDQINHSPSPVRHELPTEQLIPSFLRGLPHGIIFALIVWLIFRWPLL